MNVWQVKITTRGSKPKYYHFRHALELKQSVNLTWPNRVLHLDEKGNFYIADSDVLLTSEVIDINLQERAIRFDLTIPKKMED